MLGSEYNMNVVKEFKGTESFLDMEESSRNCQIIESKQVKCVNLKFYVNEIVLFTTGMFIKNLSRRNIKTVWLSPTKHELNRKRK